MLRDQIALVTGGASGIGRATALALAEQGASVVVADVNVDAGTEVARAVDGRFFEVDVSDFEANKRLVSDIGDLDLAFLNAGVSTGCTVGDDFDLAQYRRAMGVNLDGVVFGVHAVLPALKKRGGGAIVATSSLAGLMGVPMEQIYSANKHAVVGLVRALGPTLVADNIRINAVCPGFAESALTEPIKPFIEEAGFTLMKAEDVADVVVQLFSGDAAGECWFVQPGRAAAFEFRHVPGPRGAA
jgi:NAD(P)-dependent dehydrogenase (short-subunit alcohol dehydrogenase family)